MDPQWVWSEADMSTDAFDALPFGGIVVDYDGNIERYNQYEATLSHLDAGRVIGKNFFRDIAPCTAVQEFEGRLREFAASDQRVSRSFDYLFAFAHGPVNVSITFMKSPVRPSILIAVERVD